MIQDVSRGASIDTAEPESGLDQASPQPNRSFSEIISGYWDDESRESALAYLNSLSRSELQTIGREHGFASDQPTLYGLDLEGPNP